MDDCWVRCREENHIQSIDPINSISHLQRMHKFGTGAMR
jgi:hypothetical protein